MTEPACPLTPDEMKFGSCKYTGAQFCFVIDGDDLLIGTSYGFMREFIARVPLAEVGAFLVSHQATWEAKRETDLRAYERRRLPAVPILDEDLTELFTNLGL